MTAYTVHPRGRTYSYYKCPATIPHNTARSCDAPHFRVDQVDGAVWQYINGYLESPEKLRAGAKERQAEQEKELMPLRKRLAVTDDLIAENQTQLDRAIDLCISGLISKEDSIERKTRLKMTIDALGNDRVALTAKLEAGTITNEQIESFEKFAARARQSLVKADEDFATR